MFYWKLPNGKEEKLGKKNITQKAFSAQLKWVKFFLFLFYALDSVWVRQLFYSERASLRVGGGGDDDQR